MCNDEKHGSERKLAIGERKKKIRHWWEESDVTPADWDNDRLVQACKTHISRKDPRQVSAVAAAPSTMQTAPSEPARKKPKAPSEPPPFKLWYDYCTMQTAPSEPARKPKAPSQPPPFKLWHDHRIAMCAKEIQAQKVEMNSS